jgi:pimeloyl-ACP methyl ester carboxylesterase
MSGHSTVTSTDGTTIAFDRIGDGPPVVLVGGALSTRHSEATLAARLASQFSVVSYDRRGRGDSGDSSPYAVDREREDIHALIRAVGGSAFAFGSSSGANLALTSAAQGVPITRLALWEPNFLVDDSRAPLPADYVQHLRQLTAEGRRGDALEYFMTAAVGMPAELVAPMRTMPSWPNMEAVAHTLAYDGIAVAGFQLLTDQIATITVPTLVIDGGQTPWLSAGADALAGALPSAERRTLAGQPHNVEADAIAPLLAEYFTG